MPYEGSKTDCWSSGVVLFNLMSARKPFRWAGDGDWWFNLLKDKQHEKFWHAVLPDHPQRVSSAAKDLINRIFTTNPAHRPSIHDILYDPWLLNKQDKCVEGLAHSLISHPSCDKRKKKDKSMALVMA